MASARANDGPPPAGAGDRLHVAMAVQSFWPIVGGAQRQIQSLAPLLERRDVAVSVVTRRPPGTPRRERKAGLEVVRVRTPSSKAGAGIAYVVGGTAAMLRLRPDVIHVHDLLSPSTIGLIAGSALRVPVAAKVLSTGARGDVDRLLDKPLGRKRLEAIARRFVAFVCLSSEVEDQLVAEGVPRERLVRIANGVDCERFRPATEAERAAARAASGLPAEGLVGLYCGRFTEIKRVHLLLEAFRSLDGHLLIAGEGPEEPELRRIAAERGLEGRVRFLGVVDDTAPLYRAADIYLSSSETEGMSGSVLEAMASGLCVAATAASGMGELLGGDAGVVIEEPSAAAIAAAVASLATDPDRREAIGRAARERACGSYSLDLTADRLVALYRTLAGRLHA